MGDSPRENSEASTVSSVFEGISMICPPFFDGIWRCKFMLDSIVNMMVKTS